MKKIHKDFDAAMSAVRDCQTSLLKNNIAVVIDSVIEIPTSPVGVLLLKNVTYPSDFRIFAYFK